MMTGKPVDPDYPLTFDASAALASIVRGTPRARPPAPPRIAEPPPFAAEPEEAPLADTDPEPVRETAAATPEREPDATEAAPSPGEAERVEPVPAAPERLPVPGEMLDTRGHLRRPAGASPPDRLEPALASAFRLVQEEAALSAAIPSWKPVAEIPCPTCGEGVGFDSEVRPDGALYVARTACTSNGAIPPYASSLMVGSGRIVAANDLTSLSSIELPGRACDADLRAYDVALAATGIVLVRTAGPRAWLFRRKEMLLVGHPATGEGSDVADGLMASDEPLGCPSGGMPHLCLMDHAEFLDRCEAAGVAPETLWPLVIDVAPRPYGFLHRPAAHPSPGSVQALVAPTQSAPPAPADPGYGASVAGGQAHALLSRLAGRVGSAFGALAHAFCFPEGEFVWSGGRLRTAPRPRDLPWRDAEAGHDAGPAGVDVPAWPAMAPPLPGTPERGSARLSVIMSWTVPHIAADSFAPILRMPEAVHPHWLAAALLFADAAARRPDLFYGPDGEPPSAQVDLMGEIRDGLARRAARHPKRHAVEFAMAEWVASGIGDAG